ncbi:EexN family lipoprotein [Xanthomonas euvesicatoria]
MKLKTTLLTANCVIAMALTSCSGAKSKDWYVAHPDEATKKAEQCIADARKGEINPNGKDAKAVECRAAMEVSMQAAMKEFSRH